MYHKLSEYSTKGPRQPNINPSGKSGIYFMYASYETFLSLCVGVFACLFLIFPLPFSVLDLRECLHATELPFFGCFCFFGQDTFFRYSEIQMSSSVVTTAYIIRMQVQGQGWFVTKDSLNYCSYPNHHSYVSFSSNNLLGENWRLGQKLGGKVKKKIRKFQFTIH